MNQYNKNGFLHGYWEELKNNGKHCGFYKDGYKDGMWKCFNDNGELVSKFMYGLKKYAYLNRVDYKTEYGITYRLHPFNDIHHEEI